MHSTVPPVLFLFAILGMLLSLARLSKSPAMVVLFALCWGMVLVYGYHLGSWAIVVPDDEENEEIEEWGTTNHYGPDE